MFFLQLQDVCCSVLSTSKKTSKISLFNWIVDFSKEINRPKSTSIHYFHFFRELGLSIYFRIFCSWSKPPFVHDLNHVYCCSYLTHDFSGSKFNDTLLTYSINSGGLYKHSLTISSNSYLTVILNYSAQLLLMFL